LFRSAQALTAPLAHRKTTEQLLNEVDIFSGELWAGAFGVPEIMVSEPCECDRSTTKLTLIDGADVQGADISSAAIVLQNNIVR